MLTHEEHLEAEAALLEDAAEGDQEARRNLLRLATDAIGRGEVMSPAMRSWLLDGLILLGEAIDTRKGVPVAQKKAMSFFGARPRGRPRDDGADNCDDAAAFGDPQIAAAVELLQQKAIKTKAVEAVAIAIGKSAEEVWRSCGVVDGFARQEDRDALAAPVIARLRKVCKRDVSVREEFGELMPVTPLG